MTAALGVPDPVGPLVPVLEPETVPEIEGVTVGDPV